MGYMREGEMWAWEEGRRERGEMWIVRGRRERVKIWVVGGRRESCVEGGGKEGDVGCVREEEGKGWAVGRRKKGEGEDVGYGKEEKW